MLFVISLPMSVFISFFVYQFTKMPKLGTKIKAQLTLLTGRGLETVHPLPFLENPNHSYLI